MTNTPSLRSLEHHDAFIERHIGPNDAEIAAMLKTVGHDSLEAFTDAIVPGSIKSGNPLALPESMTEVDALAKIRAIAGKNKVFKSFIGQGYYGTHTPNVILRNILENPAWYTAYTPYQAEISQGRMEALVNFQTMICDLTGMAMANASMLDEATAAAEAMTLAKRSVKAKGNTIIVSGDCHPQTIEVIQTRAAPLGLSVKVVRSGDEWMAAIGQDDYFAAINQYPGSSGWLADWQMSADIIHGKGAALILAANPQLTWRDVRRILAKTARRNDPTNAGWTNANGLWFNHKYGFGVVDAAAAEADQDGNTLSASEDDVFARLRRLTQQKNQSAKADEAPRDGIESGDTESHAAEAATAGALPRSHWRQLGEGFVVGITNPKTIAFFVAVLPQFVDLNAGAVPLQMICLLYTSPSPRDRTRSRMPSSA